MKIRHRVACEAKAFDIVNRLIEETVSEEYLQNCVSFVTSFYLSTWYESVARKEYDLTFSGGIVIVVLQFFSILTFTFILSVNVLIIRIYDPTFHFNTKKKSLKSYFI